MTNPLKTFISTNALWGYKPLPRLWAVVLWQRRN